MTALDSLSFKYKLALLPALCLAFLVGAAGLALMGFDRLGSALESLYDERLPSYTFTARLEADMRDMNGLINQSIAFEAVGYNPDQIEPVDKALVQLAAKIAKDLDQRLARDIGAGERQAWKAIATSYVAYRKAVQETLDLKSSGLANASLFLGSANREYGALLKSLTEVSVHQLELAGADVASARADIVSGQRRIGGVALLATVLATVFGVLIARTLLSRVALLSVSMRRLAEGDLTHAVGHQGRDEIGLLMADAEAVRSRLAESMQAVNRATESMRLAASEIATGNADLGSRTEANSSALQQTSSSMTQLTVAVNENAASADRASTGASEAAESARLGGILMSQVVQTMNEITSASRRIAEITGVIDGIAFQTNILALNAAVEAARAGEQGRGFAVVASEVRTLAQRSAAAAREITGLINSSADRVDAGSKLVQQAGGSIKQLVQQVAGVAGMVTVIRSATVQQSCEIGQISASLSSLDESTQQNAALVEESTAAAESLRTQADQLAHAMLRFRLA